MSRIISTMDEIMYKSFDELKETANALCITSITKTQLQKLLLKDLKDDQFARKREAFANKKELLKLETEALEQKARFDADAVENNFRLERFKA